MAGRFTVVSQDFFKEIQIDAGVLLYNFDPENPAVPADEDIITATTGGITVSCVPSYEDLFADVDNAPDNTMEGKHLTSWACSLGATALGMTPKAIKLALGAADTGTINPNKIIPRTKLRLSDFRDLWFVGDKTDGGMVAIQIKNALSTGGFSLKTTKKGKGTSALEIAGHTSTKNLDEVPMVFYSTEGDEAETLDELTVTSAAGTESGDTSITASGHTLGTGESYVYKLATSAQSVYYGDDLSAWTDWDGYSDITATTGQVITVAVITSTGNAVAAGHATVTSAE
jgi:hypothetical protein